MTEEIPDGLHELALWGLPVLVPLLLATVARLAVVIFEIKHLRAGVLKFDSSVHVRLRGIEKHLKCASPARYALASFIAAQKDSGRTTRDLRCDFRAMLGDFERLEASVDEVLRSLEGADYPRLNGAHRQQP